MKIEKNKVVELVYELIVDGQIADKTTKERPLDFIQGTGCLLPLFEQNIEGKEPGDKFGFTIDAANGYGEWQPERVIDLPKEAFEVDGQIREDLLTVGSIIPLMNPMGGVVPGKVLEVSEKTVKMDLNHPMAGKTLNFTGEILTVRDATEKELAEGLHGEFVQHHECGCGCSGDHCDDCGGGCGEHKDGCHCDDNGEGCHCNDNGEGCHCGE